MAVIRIHHERLRPPVKAIKPRAKTERPKVTGAAAEPRPAPAPPDATRTDATERTEATEEKTAPEAPTVAAADYENRIDSALVRTRQQTQSDEQLQALLEEMAALPAITDFADVQQRLETVEQRLSASGNVA